MTDKIIGIQKVFDRLCLYKYEEYPNRFGADGFMEICINKYSSVKISLILCISGEIFGPVWNEILIESKYDNLVLESSNLKSFKKGSLIIDKYISKLIKIPNLEDIIKKYYVKEEVFRK